MGEKIKFKTLSDGLGFHPFSDGKPYTPLKPEAKAKLKSTPSTTGTGAVSAGSPTFVRPKPHLYRPPVVQSSQKSIIPPPEVELSIQPTFGYGYLVKRIFAYLLDLAVHSTICALAFGYALHRLGLSWQDFESGQTYLLAGAFLFFFSWSLVTMEEIALGTSLGKRIFNLTLIGSASEILIRSFVFLFSLTLGGLGLIWCLFNRDKRAWHDILSEVQPIEIENS
ncbi:MAG: hypothetical protein CL678_09180 [Bdellovibrionaceae bacterium]|nr:hypothetical protein [Pseudobdellovibrionaceae bacterium]